MDPLSIPNYLFFIFAIPGFVTVWCFRYFKHSEKTNDLSLLMWSFFWGLINLLLFELLVHDHVKIAQFVENPYAMAFVLSLSGFVIGFYGAFFSNRKSIKYLKKKLFDFVELN